MLPLAPGWNLEVERGPDWLIVKLHCLPDNVWDAPPLADLLWALVEQHFTYRLVLECQHLPLLHTMLIGAIAVVAAGDLRPWRHAAAVRTLGRQPRCARDAAGSIGAFSVFGTAAAVLGHQRKPR